MYGEGISREGDTLDLAANENIVEKSGAWFSYKGERLGQGRDSVKQMLKENPKLAEELRAEVLKKHNIKSRVVEAAQGLSAGAEKAHHEKAAHSDKSAHGDKKAPTKK